MTAPLVQGRPIAARPPVPLVVAGCALLTALALLQIGVAATSLRPSAANAAIDPTANATRLAVDRFYAALNVLLATGDATALEAAIDPAFVDHVAASHQQRNGSALVTELLARRRAAPDFQIDVAAVLVDGDQALAYVQTDPFAASDAPPSTTIEALRVRGGLVVERWSDDAAPAAPISTPCRECASGAFATATSVSAPSPTVHTTASGAAATLANLGRSERWSGDDVWAAMATPGTASAPRRFPRTQK